MVALCPLANLLLQSCRTIDKFIGSEAGMDSYSKLLSSDVKSKIKVCLWSNSGDMLSKVGAKDQIKNLNSALDQLDLLANLKVSFAGADSAYKAVSDQLYSSYEEGAISDIQASSGKSGANDIDTALSEINSVFDGKTGCTKATCSSPIQDSFQFASASCKAGYTLFTGGVANAQNCGQLCIPVEKMEVTVSATQASFQSRYSASCTLYADWKTRYSCLKAYDVSRRVLFGGIRDKVYVSSANSLKKTNSDLQLSMDTKIANLKQIKSDGQSLISSVNSVFDSFNCKFLSVNLNRMFESLCYTFTVPLYQMMIVLGVAACGCL